MLSKRLTSARRAHVDFHKIMIHSLPRSPRVRHQELRLIFGLLCAQQNLPGSLCDWLVHHSTVERYCSLPFDLGLIESSNQGFCISNFCGGWNKCRMDNLNLFRMNGQLAGKSHAPANLRIPQQTFRIAKVCKDRIDGNEAMRPRTKGYVPARNLQLGASFGAYDPHIQAPIFRAENQAGHAHSRSKETTALYCQQFPSLAPLARSRGRRQPPLSGYWFLAAQFPTLDDQLRPRYLPFDEQDRN